MCHCSHAYLRLATYAPTTAPQLIRLIKLLFSFASKILSFQALSILLQFHAQLLALIDSAFKLHLIADSGIIILAPVSYVAYFDPSAYIAGLSFVVCLYIPRLML